MTRRLAITLAAGALALAGVAAGCGNDDSSKTTSAPTTATGPTATGPTPTGPTATGGTKAPKSATITNPNAPDYSIEDRPGGPKKKK